MISCTTTEFPVLPLSTSPNGQLVKKLHSAYGAGLIRYLTARFGDADEAREVAQEAWLRIFRVHDAARLTNPRAFLFQTATNLGIDRVRRKQLEQTYLSEPRNDDEPLDPGMEETVARRQSLVLIEQSLQQLPEKCRLAFMLHRLQGHSYAEIAGQLGVSESMIEKYIIKALKTFRAELAAAEQPATKAEAYVTPTPPG